MRQIRSEEARRGFRDLLDEVQQGEFVEVLRYDKPVAVLVPASWFRTANALKNGVHAFTHDTDGQLLDSNTELPVGELMRLVTDIATG